MPLSVSINIGRIVPGILFCLKLAAFSGHGVIPRTALRMVLFLGLFHVEAMMGFCLDELVLVLAQ